MSLFQRYADMLEPYLKDYGYPVLFFVIFVESFGIPAPGQTVLIAAALFAVEHKLNIALVLATAWLAGFSGNLLAYWLGLRGGRRLILRYGRYFRIGRRQVRKLEKTFARYGGWFVTFARFFEVLRQLNGVVAGTAEMPFRSFLVFNALGTFLWVGTWGYGSWHFGRHMQDYENPLDQGTFLLFLLALAAFLLAMLVFRRHMHKRH